MKLCRKSIWGTAWKSIWGTAQCTWCVSDTRVSHPGPDFIITENWWHLMIDIVLLIKALKICYCCHGWSRSFWERAVPLSWELIRCISMDTISLLLSWRWCLYTLPQRWCLYTLPRRRKISCCLGDYIFMLPWRSFPWSCLWKYPCML